MSPERDLPLFPLNVVLFPGVGLPLHVFEERYRAMMRDCLARDRSFGVVLIKDGPEVGGPAIPHEVGTIARIEDLQRLPDGRMNLVALGERRFRIVEELAGSPYQRARVQLLDDEPGDVPRELVAEVTREYARYLDVLQALGQSPIVEVLQEPTALSFQVASTLRARPAVRQQLLEEPTAAQRLKRALGILHKELDLLRLLAAAPKEDSNPGPFSTN